PIQIQGRLDSKSVQHAPHSAQKPPWQLSTSGTQSHECALVLLRWRHKVSPYRDAACPASRSDRPRIQPPLDGFRRLSSEGVASGKRTPALGEGPPPTDRNCRAGYVSCREYSVRDPCRDARAR